MVAEQIRAEQTKLKRADHRFHSNYAAEVGCAAETLTDLYSFRTNAGVSGNAGGQEKSMRALPRNLSFGKPSATALSCTAHGKSLSLSARLARTMSIFQCETPALFDNLRLEKTKQMQRSRTMTARAFPCFKLMKLKRFEMKFRLFKLTRFEI